MRKLFILTLLLAHRITLRAMEVDNSITEAEQVQKVICAENSNSQDEEKQKTWSWAQLVYWAGKTVVTGNFIYLDRPIDDEGNSLLHSAVRTHDLAAIQNLLDQGYSANYANTMGRTPLHISYRNLDCLKLLWKNGGDVNKRDKLGKNVLYLASKKGLTGTVKFLLAHGSEIDASDMHGWTPLFQAVNKGHFEVALLLIEHKGNVNQKDGAGETILFYAVKAGQVAQVKFLLSNGADRECENNTGKKAIDFASLGTYYDELAPAAETQKPYLEIEELLRK